MDLDSRVIEYMKKRAECAKTIAGVVCVQCFVLAVLFSLYGLLAGNIIGKDSVSVVRLIVILADIFLNIFVAVFAVQVCIKCNDILGGDPDDIALRQSADTSREAYRIARPILIFQITLAACVLVLSGFMYILLTILMDRSFLSGIYSKVIVCLAIALASYLAIPAVDRISAYRRINNETYRDVRRAANVYRAALVCSVCAPLSICIWYILRFYSEKNEIAWIVFPIAALFGMAIDYLWGYQDAEKNS